MTKRTAKGWSVDIQPGGRTGKRFRKTFKTKAEALRWEAYVTAREVHEPWNKALPDKRRLSELVQVWYDLHGRTLKDGSRRKRKLDLIVSEMRDPLARDLSADLFTTWRALRLDRGTSPATTNRALSYLRAVFNELKRSNLWSTENPFAKVRSVRIEEDELAFLDTDQVKSLLVECDRSSNPSTGLVTRLALATGARWSEAESLRWSQLTRYRVAYSRTKSGKLRSLPISQRLYDLLCSSRIPGSRDSDRCFSPCYAAFRKATERANIELPPGQMAHVLRHTFASSFMSKGGNILVLQRALGHSSLTVTMRYAHFAPDHLDDIVRFNPLSEIFVDDPSTPRK